MIGNIFSIFSNFLHLILGIDTQKSFPPPLNTEKEKQYFKAMENGDTHAREQLILHNLRLVSHIVRKYYASAKNQEYLVLYATCRIGCKASTVGYAKRVYRLYKSERSYRNEILLIFSRCVIFSDDM